MLVEDGIRSRRGSDMGQKESGGSGRGGAPFCGGQQLEFRSPRRCEGEEKARRAALSAKTQALQATGWASERASVVLGAAARRRRVRRWDAAKAGREGQHWQVDGMGIRRAHSEGSGMGCAAARGGRVWRGRDSGLARRRRGPWRGALARSWPVGERARPRRRWKAETVALDGRRRRMSRCCCLSLV